MIEGLNIPFKVGSPVNVTAIGYPYYAAVVESCDEKYVTVNFPFSKNANRHHKYPLKDVKPFKKQVIGNSLMPIKYTLKKLTRTQKKNIKMYETNVLKHISN